MGHVRSDGVCILGRPHPGRWPYYLGADGQIAAIAAVHGYTVATRDTAPFIGVGVPVINPWEI